MASMQHRYSRGQSGQGSLPRPAWNSGNHGARAASPEPGGGNTPLGGVDPSKSHADRPEDVLSQLETEVSQLSNACAMKDQRIAELLRAETQVSRLKKDIRLLAAELHATRKQLSESVNEQEKLKSHPSSAKDGRTASSDVTLPQGNDTAESPSSASAERGSGSLPGGSDKPMRELMDRLSVVEDENRQLKELLAQAQAVGVREQNYENVQYARQASGASTQRASESQPQQIASASGGYRGSDPGMAARYAVGQHAFGVHAPAAGGGLLGPSTQREEPPPPRQVVYSTQQLEGAKTLGPTHVEGIGLVDGVSSVAKLVLQRTQSSVYATTNRQQMRVQVPA